VPHTSSRRGFLLLIARRLIFGAMVTAFLTPGTGWGVLAAQSGQQEGMQQSQSGMANAGPKTAQFDSQHRPITAGGFVKTGPIIFQDVAKEAGLTS